MGTKAYADVGIIPLNGECNMLLKIGNIVFVGVDNRSGHIPHDRICHSRRVKLRYALANFPAMSDYRSDLPTSHLLYLDCNSLYTTCQTYPLPVGRFRFLTDAELLTFDVGMWADSPTGYFVECDLRYPAELHALHNAYPLAPEHVYILEEMLSDTVRLMQDITGILTFLARNSSRICATRCVSSHTIVVCSSICPRTRIGQDSPCVLRSLSTRTCYPSSNFVMTDGKTRSPNSSRPCTN